MYPHIRDLLWRHQWPQVCTRKVPCKAWLFILFLATRNMVLGIPTGESLEPVTLCVTTLKSQRGLLRATEEVEYANMHQNNDPS